MAGEAAVAFIGQPEFRRAYVLAANRTRVSDHTTPTPASLATEPSFDLSGTGTTQGLRFAIARSNR